MDYVSVIITHNNIKNIYCLAYPCFSNQYTYLATISTEPLTDNLSVDKPLKLQNHSRSKKSYCKTLYIALRTSEIDMRLWRHRFHERRLDSLPVVRCEISKAYFHRTIFFLVYSGSNFKLRLLGYILWISKFSMIGRRTIRFLIFDCYIFWAKLF